MKAYKGFNKDMTLRGFQYDIGNEYETYMAKLCEAGFHACKYPLDVWDYYPPNGNRFCEVEQFGKIETDGKKTVSNKIKIGAEIGIAGLVKAHIEWISEQTKSIFDKILHPSKIKKSSGYDAQIGSSGNNAKIECTGENAVVACAGKNNIVKASIGTWICLSEYGDNEICIGMKVFKIDGKKYKADIWYMLKNGKVVEV